MTLVSNYKKDFADQRPVAVAKHNSETQHKEIAPASTDNLATTSSGYRHRVAPNASSSHPPLQHGISSITLSRKRRASEVSDETRDSWKSRKTKRNDKKSRIELPALLPLDVEVDRKNYDGNVLWTGVLEWVRKYFKEQSELQTKWMIALNGFHTGLWSTQEAYEELCNLSEQPDEIVRYIHPRIPYLGLYRDKCLWDLVADINLDHTAAAPVDVQSYNPCLNCKYSKTKCVGAIVDSECEHCLDKARTTCYWPEPHKGINDLKTAKAYYGNSSSKQIKPATASKPIHVAIKAKPRISTDVAHRT
ncbi:hypothetical protein LTR66_017630 [Elasticomyces elasticus]|nr:hypothetical protein LTR66_017630 [Elasticomyces elasticus]